MEKRYFQKFEYHKKEFYEAMLNPFIFHLKS